MVSCQNKAGGFFKYSTVYLVSSHYYFHQTFLKLNVRAFILEKYHSLCYWPLRIIIVPMFTPYKFQNKYSNHHTVWHICKNYLIETTICLTLVNCCIKCRNISMWKNVYFSDEKQIWDLLHPYVAFPISLLVTSVKQSAGHSDSYWSNVAAKQNNLWPFIDGSWNHWFP